jgi:hypothetical protein
MPRRSQPATPEDVALDQLEFEDEDELNRLVAEAGPPPDAKRMSESDEDEAWGFMDPDADYDALTAAMPTQGIPPEQAQQFLYLKLHPDALEEVSQPTGSLEKAHILARLIQHPFRRSMLEDEADPAEQVRKADRLEARRQKRLTQLQEQQSLFGGARIGGQGYG